MTHEPDFIVSELLSELKSENERKDQQIQGLHKVIATVVAGALCAILLVVAGFLWYLNQYDFSSTETITDTVTNTAEGVYAVIDSEGNVISSDLTAEEIERLTKGVIVDGCSADDSN